MPTYGYECINCKEKFEVVQRMSDPSLTVHEACGGNLRKLLYPVGIVFKGSGFHVNDYARKSPGDTAAKAADASDAKADTKIESKPETKTESSTETKIETKSEVKTEVKADKTPA